MLLSRGRYLRHFVPAAKPGLLARSRGLDSLPPSFEAWRRRPTMHVHTAESQLPSEYPGVFRRQKQGKDGEWLPPANEVILYECSSDCRASVRRNAYLQEARPVSLVKGARLFRRDYRHLASDRHHGLTSDQAQKPIFPRFHPIAAPRPLGPTAGSETAERLALHRPHAPPCP